MERDIFKKGYRHLLGPAEMSFCFIEDHRNAYPVRTLCAVLEVSPSGYYACWDRPESVRHVADRGLTAEIRRIHTAAGKFHQPRVRLRRSAGGIAADQTVDRAGHSRQRPRRRQLPHRVQRGVGA